MGSFLVFNGKGLYFSFIGVDFGLFIRLILGGTNTILHDNSGNLYNFLGTYTFGDKGLGGLTTRLLKGPISISLTSIFLGGVRRISYGGGQRTGLGDLNYGVGISFGIYTIGCIGGYVELFIGRVISYGGFFGYMK